MPPAFIDNPVINSPYLKPARHFALDETGAPTGAVIEGRRKSEFVVAVAAPRRGGAPGRRSWPWRRSAAASVSRPTTSSLTPSPASPG
jgi:hypothetical protein